MISARLKFMGKRIRTVRDKEQFSRYTRPSSYNDGCESPFTRVHVSRMIQRDVSRSVTSANCIANATPTSYPAPSSSSFNSCTPPPTLSRRIDFRACALSRATSANECYFMARFPACLSGMNLQSK